MLHQFPVYLFTYRVFIKYCVFSIKCWNFSELCQFCCSAGVLPAIWRSKREVRCTLTDTEGKQRKSRVRNILKIREKTQYLMNILHLRRMQNGDRFKQIRYKLSQQECHSQRGTNTNTERLKALQRIQGQPENQWQFWVERTKPKTPWSTIFL